MHFNVFDSKDRRYQFVAALQCSFSVTFYSSPRGREHLYFIVQETDSYWQSGHRSYRYEVNKLDIREKLYHSENIRR